MQINGKEMRDYVREYQRLSEKYKREGINVHTREKIANDMGLSVQQADRYKKIYLLISEIQELIFTDQIGMSNVYPIASHNIAEQHEIYGILQSAIRDNYKMSRSCVMQIVSEYRNGKRIWDEIKPKCASYASRQSQKSVCQHKEAKTFTSFESSLDSIKKLTGDEFALWFANFLKATGYCNVKVTGASHDEGVDIIVQKDSINYCFQCKNQNRVYLSAFQEVFYGKPDNCNIPVVVTTGSIAKTAMLSGERHGIQSWDGKYLSKLIKDAQQLDEYSTDYLIDNFECK